MATFTWNEFHDIDRAVQTLGNPDATALVIGFRHEIVADNTHGLINRLDKDDRPLAPVTYRPKPPPKHPRSSSRLLPNNNLAPEVYRTLTGPPLAPRYMGSRIITALETAHSTAAPWQAWGAWKNVVNAKGVPFLEYLFDGNRGSHRNRDAHGRFLPKAQWHTGSGNLPGRDMRGLRNWGYGRCLDRTEKWIEELLRHLFP